MTTGRTTASEGALTQTRCSPPPRWHFGSRQESSGGWRRRPRSWRGRPCARWQLQYHDFWTDMMNSLQLAHTRAPGKQYRCVRACSCSLFFVSLEHTHVNARAHAHQGEGEKAGVSWLLAWVSRKDAHALTHARTHTRTGGKCRTFVLNAGSISFILPHVSGSPCVSLNDGVLNPPQHARGVQRQHDASRGLRNDCTRKNTVDQACPLVHTFGMD